MEACDELHIRDGAGGHCQSGLQGQMHSDGPSGHEPRPAGAFPSPSLATSKAFETLQAVIIKSMKLRMHIKEGTHCLLSSLLFGTRYQHVRQLAKKGYFMGIQAVQKGLASLGGPGSAEAAADALRLVDTYIKVSSLL